jgi:hypothetical protein
MNLAARQLAQPLHAPLRHGQRHAIITPTRSRIPPSDTTPLIVPPSERSMGQWRGISSLRVKSYIQTFSPVTMRADPSTGLRTGLVDALDLNHKALRQAQSERSFTEVP